jgi:DNA-directed RNA polymerase subunit RPC12/RpoP
MGLLTKVRGLFESDDRTFNYQCTNCEATFESPHADMSRVSCPECAATRVRSVSMTEP